MGGDEDGAHPTAQQETDGKSAEPWGAGMVLAGRYMPVRCLEKRGEEGVWLAEDVRLDGKKVAIQMLPTFISEDKRERLNLIEEVEKTWKLRHPNIAALWGFERDERDNWFLVAEYVEGKTLDEILAERGALGEGETLRLLGPVAAALDYAHGKGMAHRDVQAENVVVRKDGTPFVRRFGIARELQAATTLIKETIVTGPLACMDPKRLAGTEAAKDVYGFAALAYECLTGKPPFSRERIQWQIQGEAPEELPESVGAGLRRGIKAGLSPEPAQRPDTCAGVLSGKWNKRKAARRETGGRKASGITGLVGYGLGAICCAAMGICLDIWWSERERGPSVPEEDPEVSTNAVDRTPSVPARYPCLKGVACSHAIPAPTLKD